MSKGATPGAVSEWWWVVVDGGLVALAFASDACGVFGVAGAFA
jgi:hypothetical protein